MAVGQSALAGSLDVAGLLAVEDRLERRAVDVGRVHAALLRDVLDLHTRHLRAGLPLSTVPQVALLLRCSEWRAGRLLEDALGLAELPDALSALECGLLTVEQSTVVVAQLGVLDAPTRLRVWERLVLRLRADLEQGVVRPPARLTELLRRWVVEADRDAAQERRTQSEQERRVEYRRRQDGLTDVFLMGLRAPDAQAVLDRVRAAAEPSGPDERTADQRRLDAARDLLLGRGGPGGCDCPPGTAAPCGAGVLVLVPLGAALGTTDEVADLVGHGPVEPDLVQRLLENGARLTPVHIDDRGVPVAVGRPVTVPGGSGAGAVREALLGLVDQPLPHELHARHPADHQALPAAARRPAPPLGHPPDAPGGYVVPRRLRRMVFVRAPRCEFPGCGARAVRCDAEHDLAWPAGPTCACNLGPCCRRHHRVKQEGWRKTRTSAGVVWTSPSGRVRLSPQQHDEPQPWLRPTPAVPAPDPLAELSPTEQDEELWRLLDRPDDPVGLELRVADVEPDDLPLRDRDTRWSRDLEDPYAWAG